MMVVNDEVLRALNAVPYFRELDESLVHLIAGQTIRREYAAGQVVLVEGEPEDAVYIVQQGWLKAVKISPDGREHALQFIGPAEVFNAIGIFVDAANPATVITLEPTIAWMIPRDTILHLLDTYPQLARIVIRRLAGRVQHLVTMVEDLSLRSLESRLARYLIEQASGEQVQRPRWATQAELANRLGTVPDVLNRTLRNLEKENLIAVKRHQIQILDYAGLAAKAGYDR